EKRRALNIIGPVNRIDAVNDGNAEARLFCRALNLANDIMPPVQRQGLILNVENGPYAVMRDRSLEFGGIDLNVLISSVRNHADLKLGHLANFLFKRHSLQQ